MPSPVETDRWWSPFPTRPVMRLREVRHAVRGVDARDVTVVGHREGVASPNLLDGLAWLAGQYARLLLGPRSALPEWLSLLGSG